MLWPQQTAWVSIPCCSPSDLPQWPVGAQEASADVDCFPQSNRHFGSNVSFIHKVHLLTVFMFFMRLWQLHVGKEMKGKPFHPYSSITCFLKSLLQDALPMLPLSYLPLWPQLGRTNCKVRASSRHRTSAHNSIWEKALYTWISSFTTAHSLKIK